MIIVTALHAGRLSFRDRSPREGAVSNDVACEVCWEGPQDGPVRLQFSGDPFLNIWIDGAPARAGNAITAELAAGKHTFVVKLDPKRLPDQLRLQASQATFLTN